MTTIMWELTGAILNYPYPSSVGGRRARDNGQQWAAVTQKILCLPSKSNLGTWEEQMTIGLFLYIERFFRSFFSLKHQHQQQQQPKIVRYTFFEISSSKWSSVHQMLFSCTAYVVTLEPGAQFMLLLSVGTAKFANFLSFFLFKYRLEYVGRRSTPTCSRFVPRLNEKTSGRLTW